MWILLNFTFVWAVGVSRFTDNKHSISDVLGGWIMDFAFRLSICITQRKYVVMHNMHEIDDSAQLANTKPAAVQEAATVKTVPTA